LAAFFIGCFTLTLHTFPWQEIIPMDFEIFEKRLEDDFAYIKGSDSNS